jgi:hypothetical protein
MNADMTGIYKIEPEVAAPPPRDIALPARLRRRHAWAVAAMALLCLGAGLALWEAGKLAWLGSAGTLTYAYITEVRQRPAPLSDDPLVQTGVAYEFDEKAARFGLPHRISVELPREQETGLMGQPHAAPRRYRVGERLTFRAARWLGRPVLRPWSRAAPGQILFLCGIGLAILLTCLYVFLRLRSANRLVENALRNHLAVMGTIVARRVSPEQPPAFYVEYRYTADDGDERHREARCSEAQWRELAVDRQVTVLYDPMNPDSAALHALLSLV